MMKRKDDQKGFTLVELIIVMAILAILAAIAIPKYNGVLAKAKTDANESNKTIIKQAAELYCDANQGDLASIEALVSAHYLNAVPINPVNSKKYTAIATYDAATGVVGTTVTDI
jgi:type IV pilus assembly protein PilA